MKPRIFLGSSGQQEKLLQALTRGLQDIADVEPWTTVFNPGVSTLDRLVELTREVDFAAFVFAHDDWTTKGPSPEAASGEASPRDTVVFEAGLFGGALGMRRTFILHANGAKLPTDLLGLTSIRYDPDTTPAIVRQINRKLREAIAAEGRISRLEGDWWRSDGADAFYARTSGIYFRADSGDAAVLDGNDAAERAALIERRLEDWKSLANS
jgi:predicted nucleotide-binding protein